MLEPIGEQIAVAGVYKSSGFEPRYFMWNHTKYDIQKITLISDVKDGNIKKRHYSVLVKNQLFRLLFDRDSEKWTLEEVWVE